MFAMLRLVRVPLVGPGMNDLANLLSWPQPQWDKEKLRALETSGTTAEQSCSQENDSLKAHWKSDGLKAHENAICMC